MWWFIFLAILLWGLYFLPTFLENRRKPMNRTRRAAAPGKFAELSQGVTHYRWIGPTRGPVAVMIHGLTTSSPVWEEIAHEVAETGYRVLVYDLYNRGFSDSVKGPHNTQLYLNQLDELLADQGLEESLTLIGFSMGGVIATEFAATEPHRMQRLILLAPGGVEISESKFAKFCRTKWLVGGWWHGVWAKPRFTRQINEDEAAAAKPHIRDAQVMELNRRGFFPAVLGCRRNVLHGTQERQHRAITRDGIPTIAIWGEDDTVIPISSVGLMAQWNRKALHEVIKGAGHSLPYSHPEEVMRLLRGMLRGE